MFKEYRSVIFVVVILLIVNAIALITFTKLSAVSNKISQTIQSEIPSSIIAKQILLEIRSSENYARSYYLTREYENMNGFYKSTLTIKNLLKELSSLKEKYPEDSFLIDSVEYHSRIGIQGLKSQLFLENTGKLIGALDQLSRRIDKLYLPEKEEVKATKKIESDSLQKKEKKGFFKRLFGKKEKSKDTVPAVSPTISTTEKTKEVKKKLEEGVVQVKTTQSRIIEETKKSEYTLTQIVFKSREKINANIEALRINEELRRTNRIKIAREETNKLKYFSSISSILLSVFLLLLIYFIVIYVRRKSLYEKMLLDARYQAENLAGAREKFLANMSHEIKTPLNAIYGFSEVLLDTPLNPEQSKQLNIIKSSASYLTKLVNNVLTNARYNSGKVQLLNVTVNLNRELEELQHIVEQQTKGKDIKLSFSSTVLNDKLCVVDIDKLKQVLYNVLGNAIKFTEKGFVNLDVACSTDTDIVSFKVSDSGVGIDEKNLPNLFKEFEQGGEQTQARYGGTGLGLVITKKIVEELGGQISIESKLNHGTSVSIHIPVKFVEAETKHETSKGPSADFGFIRHKKILIADDEEYNRMLLKSILSKWEVEITEAINGLEVMSIVRTREFDLIIMDVRMPEMNGIEATIEVRKLYPGTPILGATAVMNEEKIERCRKAGMNDVIFKPYSANELSVKLQVVLNQEKPLASAKRPSILFNPEETTINFKALDESIEGDEDLKKELVQVFYHSLGTAKKQLPLLFKKGDLAAINDLAHKIIPSCKHLEANKLLKSLYFFEQLKDLSEVNVLNFKTQLKIFNSEVAKINKLIQEFLS